MEKIYLLTVNDVPTSTAYRLYSDARKALTRTVKRLDPHRKLVLIGKNRWTLGGVVKLAITWIKVI